MVKTFTFQNSSYFSFYKFFLTFLVFYLPHISQAQNCSINNLQGTVFHSSQSLFATPGNGAFTLFDPSVNDADNNPGCGLVEPYVYQINSIFLNMGDAFLVGQTSDGAGNYEFKVAIYSAINSDGCMEVGEELFSTDVLTEVMDLSGFHFRNIPIGFSVGGPFFVFIETVSWDGNPGLAPSVVLWDQVQLPSCRQYFKTDGGSSIVAFSEIFDENLGGWFNVTVNGSVVSQGGFADFHVLDVEAEGDLFIQGENILVTANVHNMGTSDVINGSLVLLENGVEVESTFLTLGEGEFGEAIFIYAPQTIGELELTVVAQVSGDNNPDNDQATTTITVVGPPDNDLCENAANISTLLGGDFNVELESGIFTNQYSTISETDPNPNEETECWEEPALSNTVWFSFTGDGNDYLLTTTDCNGNAVNYIPDGNTQLAVFTGNCSALTQVACNDDELDLASQILVPTSPGENYFIMMDGFGESTGEFCISVNNQTSVGVNDQVLAGFSAFPNPVGDKLTVSFPGKMDQIEIYNMMGQLVQKTIMGDNTNTVLDFSSRKSGVYLLKVFSEGKIHVEKIVKD